MLDVLGVKPIYLDKGEFEMNMVEYETNWGVVIALLGMVAAAIVLVAVLD